MSNIKYKTKEDKIGETRLNKRGTLTKLIEYRNTYDCDVEFQDDYKFIFEHANYQNFLKGQIANPYDKTTYGIGMIGHGKYLTKIKNAHTTWYKCWVDVIRRCYIDKKNFPAYYEISTICDEWLIFQNFAEWYHNNWYEIPNNERLHIDKDILVPGNKCYSPETCVFVPQKINMLFTNMGRKDGLPNGIRKTVNGEKFLAMYNKNHLGCFDALEDAYDKYAKEKEKAIQQRADEYRKYIPEKLYIALLNYKVKMEYDKNYDENHLI